MDAFWDGIGGKFIQKTVEMGNGKGCIEWTGCKK